MRDLLSGEEYHWGEHNYVRLDPHFRCAHVFTVTRTVVTAVRTLPVRIDSW